MYVSVWTVVGCGCIREQGCITFVETPDAIEYRSSRRLVRVSVQIRLWGSVKDTRPRKRARGVRLRTRASLGT